MATYLITGTNRGLGLEMVRQIAAAGHRVIAACRDPSGSPALQAIAAGRPGQVETVALDVTTPASVEALAERLGGQPVDVLINNAGVKGPQRQSVLDMDFDGFAQTFQVNTLAPLRLTQALLPNLAASPAGKVIVLSSLMGSFSMVSPAEIAYCASKTAVNRVFQALAQELKPRGIAVLLLSPGWVRTDMGGPSAPLDVETSIAGIRREIDELALERSGAYRNYAGQDLTW